MATKYGKKKRIHGNLFRTLITVILLCAVFLSVVNYLYSNTINDAYEVLHLQTKQIKDDLTLQIISDRENLATMANFAAKLYSDSESYSIMFESFKPIGLIENIGILNPDNTFSTKAGVIDLSGKISFDEVLKYTASVLSEHTGDREISARITENGFVPSSLPTTRMQKTDSKRL